MKRVLLGMLVFYGISLYATDVSEFDIKGIKLGMSKEEVLKMLQCKKPMIDTYYFDPSIELKSNMIKCEENNEGFMILFDNFDEVLRISLERKFNAEPDWNIIEKRLFKKYGETEAIRDSRDKYRHLKSYCWGTCYYYREKNDGFYVDFKDGKIGLSITWKHYFDSGNYIYFSLKDGSRGLRFKKLIEAKKHGKNIQEKKKEASFSF